MKLHNCTLQFIKDLYMVKVSATERKDNSAINHLKKNYPELFNPEFLLDVLRNEFERTQTGESKNLPLKHYLTITH
jgi:hypothetical protein